MVDARPDRSQPDALLRVRDALLAHDELVRASLTGRREQPHRIQIRPVHLRAGVRVQVNAHLESRSQTRNLTPDEFAGEVDELLCMGWRSFHVTTTRRTIDVRAGKRGKLLIRDAPATRTVDHAHDQAKRRVLASGAPFLHALGVAGPDGRVHAAKQAKYRQIDKFLRLLQEAFPLSELPRPVRIADLGCGNADLTFATYHHLVHGLGIRAHVTGVDVKPDAVERNNALAHRLGWTGLRFVADRIARYQPDEPPHVVLALHACDTATDDALSRAVTWRSKLILAAPCCHHHLQEQLSTASAPPEYALLLRHRILLQRFGDVLTDALRASIVTMHGYRTDVFQFVSTEHTARNVMIRAVRTGAPAAASEIGAYSALRDQWRVTPKLEQLLDDRRRLHGAPQLRP